MRLHGINRDVFDRYRSTKPAWHYEVVAPGYKYNLTDPAAAMGRVQLARARAMRDRRSAIAERYDRGLRTTSRSSCPRGAPGRDDQHAWHLYVTRLPARRGSGRLHRARWPSAASACSVHFIPLHLQPVVARPRGAATGAVPGGRRRSSTVS